AGHREFGDTVREQIDRMQRQIDYHLAHARAAASAAAPGARSGVAESADGVARALRRLHEDRRLAIEVCAPAEHAVRCQREDLDEMLGNLLENACKWAGTRVAVQSALDGNAVVVTVDDDGPGIAAEKPARRARAESSFHLVERGYGRFARVVRLGRACDTSRAKATLIDGELRVTLPKVADRRGRLVPIAIAGAAVHG